MLDGSGIPNPHVPKSTISQRVIRIARLVHLWIGLGLGLHFSLIATTGGIFVFNEELANLAQAWRGWKASAGDLGPDRCADAIAAAYPEWNRAFLQFPSEDQPYYSAYIGDDTDYFWTDVYVDPGSGQIVGAINNLSWSIEGLLQVSIQLHIRLCSGEWGRKFVDVSVALLLVEISTGLLLWWPGWTRLSRGFQIRLASKRFLAIYDWHRVSGVLAAPVLLAMTLTGLLWGFPEVMVPLVYWSCGEATPPTVQRKAIEPQLPLSDTVGVSSHYCARSEAAQIVQERTPHFRITGIYLHGPHQRIARVSGRTVAETAMGFPQELAVEVDRQTRQILSSDSVQREPTIADQLVNEWAHRLHYGDFGGLATKLLYLAACVAVDGLFMTAVWMWVIKRRKRKLQAPVSG